LQAACDAKDDQTLFDEREDRVPHEFVLESFSNALDSLVFHVPSYENKNQRTDVENDAEKHTPDVDNKEHGVVAEVIEVLQERWIVFQSEHLS